MWYAAKCAANPELERARKSAKRRAWYVANRERECAKNRVKRAENPQLASAKRREWYAANRERECAKNRVKTRAKYAANPAPFIARTRAQRAAHPELFRAWDLRRNFGITHAQYDTMLARQGGVCAICGTPPTTLRLAVDHERGGTGRVRGLLCSCCNTSRVGANTLETARQVAAYLAADFDGRQL